MPMGPMGHSIHATANCRILVPNMGGRDAEFNLATKIDNTRHALFYTMTCVILETGYGISYICTHRYDRENCSLYIQKKKHYLEL